jgi:hypothetical protein
MLMIPERRPRKATSSSSSNVTSKTGKHKMKEIDQETYEVKS